MLLTRDSVLSQLGEVIVVPATTTVRGLRSEVFLSVDDGMPKPCALNFDHVGIVPKAKIGDLICSFGEDKWEEARTALLAACGFSA